jgi:hypothetical protein
MVDDLFKGFLLFPLVAFEETLDHTFIIVVSSSVNIYLIDLPWWELKPVVCDVLSEVFELLHLFWLIPHACVEYHTLL